MIEKDIKRLAVKQLKKCFPNWQRLPKDKKKKLAKLVLDEISASYTLDQSMSIPLNELTSTPVPPAGVIPLNEMEGFVVQTTRHLLTFPNKLWQKHFDDRELRLIDNLLDDEVVNRLLAPESYIPSMRNVYPANYFRAELLKSLRYPEVSYLKYCHQVINKLDRKRERAFLHLSLRKHVCIDHSQLSRFRTGLTFTQMVNLMTYMAYLLVKKGKISNPFHLCGVDSTELVACCSSFPLAKVTIGDKTVRIYSELDADCGKRRKKRNKSEYFVGYRLHTLVAIDPQTGCNYPLFSLVAPSNHHDNLFLEQILAFAKAMGLSIKVITADEGYVDTERNEKIQKEYGVTVITPASRKANIPGHIDPKTHAVYMNGHCEIPMSYVGRTDLGHEFACGADPQQCFYSPTCAKYREIPLDARLFGQIPDQVDGVERVRSIRKHLERAFNLLKHREGLETLRVRSQHGVMVAATFAQMATLLLEIVGTRRTINDEVTSKQL
ncbi:MAG: transposase [Deltaproteobacteria bacterium]|nr:transposase [Deltaproteobacteria bacterium]